MIFLIDFLRNLNICLGILNLFFGLYLNNMLCLIVGIGNLLTAYGLHKAGKRLE